MHSRAQFLVQAAPVILVLFIDSIGLGLVIPVLSGLIFNPQSQFLDARFSSPFMHDLIYGAVLSVFMLCWFFGAAFLGDLSDKIGRKKSLIICLVGALLSYLISAISISLHSVSLLMLGRVINGLTSGSQPIAQASIMDLSHPQQKARNMSYMLFAMSIGFVLGPLLGGIFSDSQFVSWFDYQTPFYLAALLALIDIILLIFFFKETFVATKEKINLKFWKAFHLFISAFKHPKIKKISVLYTFFIIGWSSFYSFISTFLMKSYSFTSTEVSFYMGLMGVGFALGNAVVVEILAAKMTNPRIFFYAALVGGIVSMLIALIPNSLAAWILIVPMAAAVATTGPALLTLLSEQVGPEAQGWAMGVTGSIMALVWAIDGIIIGALGSLGTAIPIYIAAIFLLITAALTPSFLKNM